MHDNLCEAFEGPANIHWVNMYNDITAAAANDKKTLILVEGHMVATCAKIRALASGVVMFQGNSVVAKQRRMGRKSNRTDEEKVILDQYIDMCVWKHHEKYAVPACEEWKMECANKNVTCLSVVDQVEKEEGSSSVAPATPENVVALVELHFKDVLDGFAR